MDTNILVSAAGRRAELIQCFQSSLAELGLEGQVLGADASSLAPARGVADGFVTIPVVWDDAYLPRMVELVESRSITLVVPTIDTELPYLDRYRHQLGDAGAFVLVAGRQTTVICGDKVRTHAFLDAADIACPQQWSADAARRDAEDLAYPVVVKPIAGSSSVGVWVAESSQELRHRILDTDIVQSLAPGDEYTVDVWVDRDGAVRSVVPRRRIEVRGGEVSKGVTAHHQMVEQLARKTAEALPDAYGPLTIQVFADGESAQVIEINPRFGGGYPLSWQAGARTTVWALQDALGAEHDPADFGWEEGLHMLRYDQSLFLRQEDLTP